MAGILLEGCGGVGLAIFDCGLRSLTCLFLSPRARYLLGNEPLTEGADAQAARYLPMLQATLLTEHRVNKEPFTLSLPDYCLEIECCTKDTPTGRRMVVVLRELNTAQSNLREERDRLARALAASGQAVWEWNLETGAAFVSERWAEMLGRTDGNAEVDALYSPENFLDAIHPDDRDKVAEAYADFIVGARAVYDIEFRMRHADGAYRWIRSRADALRRDDGTAWRVTGAHADITETKELEVVREKLLHQQSRIAETLQRVLLPLPNVTRFPDMELALHYEPAMHEAAVGGDFCDAFPIGDREIALIVGDVTGKGLNAAVVTAEIKFTLRTLLRQYRDPAVTLQLLNRLLWESYRSERKENPPLVPISIVVANIRTRYLRCSVAGAEPPMILRDYSSTARTTEEITAGGMLIGAMPDEKYERHIVALGPDDCLVMTTDGLTEVRDSWTGTFLGTKGVARLAQNALTLGRPLEDIISAVVHQVRNYGGGDDDALRDDVSLLMARWRQTAL